jgi:hypothetical protein
MTQLLVLINAATKDTTIISLHAPQILPFTQSWLIPPPNLWLLEIRRALRLFPVLSSQKGQSVLLFHYESHGRYLGMKSAGMWITAPRLCGD